MIYLDSAATTLQKPAAVAAASARAIRTLTSPGRGGHRTAQEAGEAAYTCRELAGSLLGVSDPERVVFTFNATHALNIAIRSLVRPGDRVVISGWEHNAVTRPLHAAGAHVAVAAGPLFDRGAALDAFDRLLTPDTVCAVCTHVSNVFGMVLPVAEISQLCRRRGIPLIVDAAQSAGCLSVDTDGWGAAYVALPGHKGLYGPQGTGLLLCGRDTIPTPLLYGGTGSASLLKEMLDFLPDRLEAGTHNVAGIAGLVEGLRYVMEEGPAAILAHETALTALACDGLRQMPGVEVFAAREPDAQSGVVSFRVVNRDCEEIAQRLGEEDVAVRAGLHCAPLAHESAGTVDTGTVRVSFSAFNTRREVETFLMLVEGIVRKT